VLVIGAEERRFWGYKHLYYYFRFQFCGVLQFLVAEKVNFNAEKVANLSTA